MTNEGIRADAPVSEEGHRVAVGTKRQQVRLNIGTGLASTNPGSVLQLCDVANRERVLTRATGCCFDDRSGKVMRAKSSTRAEHQL